MEKLRFEEELRRKLDGYSSRPSSGLWDELDRSLNQTERDKRFSSRIRYSAMAAMVALVAVSFSIWQVTNSSDQKNKLAAAVKQMPLVNEDVRASAELEKNPKQKSGTKKEESLNSVATTGTVKRTKARPKHFDSDERAENGFQPMKNSPNYSEVKDGNEQAFTGSAETHVPVLPMELNIADRLDFTVTRDLSLAYRVADVISKIEHQKKEPVRQASWLAVGFASGNYQQQVLAGNRDTGSSRASAVYYGRNIGRLAFFTGLALAEQQYNKSSDLAYGASSARQVMSAEVMSSNVAASANLTPTNTYLVNTQKRYLSVPVQAGWFVLDGRVKGMLSAGVVSDYFLSSTLSDVSGVLQTSTVRRSSETSYSGWVFSGLAGTEWSMNFSNHYQVGLSPGLRYAFTPVYRKDFFMNGKSYAFDVAIRLRYFF